MIRANVLIFKLFNTALIVSSDGILLGRMCFQIFCSFRRPPTEERFANRIKRFKGVICVPGSASVDKMNIQEKQPMGEKSGCWANSAGNG